MHFSDYPQGIYDQTSFPVAEIISVRYAAYMVRKFCLWGGKTPEDALDAAMLETMGEA